MNILIADDESGACQYLSGMIKSLPGCYDVGHAENGVEAVYKAYDLDIDVVLMDVRMPRMNGLEAARYISGFDNPPAVVFTTAYLEHAIDAFDVNASGFLLKPIQPSRMVEVLEKLRRNPVGKGKVSEPAVFDESENSYICCRIRQGLNLLALNKILYLKAESKYTLVRHVFGCSMTDKPLKMFEERLGDRLLRVHRRILVNKAYVAGIEKGEKNTYFMVLRGSEEKLEISRRSLPSVREYLNSFMEPRLIVRRREAFLTQYALGKR